MSGELTIAVALVLALALLLISRFLHRDSQVKSTKLGLYVERERYDQTDEVWTIDPLNPESETRPIPPPTPPPPIPRSAWEPDAPTKVDWPKKEDE